VFRSPPLCAWQTADMGRPTGSRGHRVLATMAAAVLVQLALGLTASAVAAGARAVPGAIEGISCRPGECVAVGQVQNAVGSVVGSDVWTLRHGTWSASGESPQYLERVSCPQAGSCIAVSTVGKGYAEQLHDGTWQQLPVPGSPLVSISCASTSWCMALPPSDIEGSQPYSYLWNGSTWSRLDVVPGPGQSGGGLASASCVGTSFCMAVGPRRTRHSSRSGTAPNGRCPFRRTQPTRTSSSTQCRAPRQASASRSVRGPRVT
jgi:hypothetical protein